MARKRTRLLEGSSDMGAPNDTIVNANVGAERLDLGLLGRRFEVVFVAARSSPLQVNGERSDISTRYHARVVLVALVAASNGRQRTVLREEQLFRVVAACPGLDSASSPHLLHAPIGLRTWQPARAAADEAGQRCEKAYVAASREPAAITASG